ncbi:MAG: hypothetical protein M1829_002571 [Trizodia sp. TS-e1964]|nr:MAG: hypothetical protein M1829_002571 [Trizodia sp. TS-e1964]
MASEPEVYHPKDTLRLGLNTTAIMGAAGLFTSAVQNSLTKANVGPWGVFTIYGGTIARFAAMGGMYELVKNGSANLREKDDSWNSALGGMFGGAALGMRRGGSFQWVLLYGAGLAVTLGVYDYTGGSLAGAGRDPEVDEFERKQALRKNRRRPIQEIVEELGEGRGIYGPGYDERRRQRVFEKYGVEVPAKPTSASP